MRVLVGYASKHGGTREIAERIAARLKQSGLDVDLCSIAQSSDAVGFDAYVLGSSIYMGHWNKEAIAFVHRNRPAFEGRPVWLFSSGPVGSQERLDPIDLADLRATVAIREHRLFSGAVKLDQMSFAERLMAKAMKVSGDYREWPAIDAWADQIRTELSTAVITAQS
jgi:menaquinone-dependent protoporphyrinogen oxidase